MKFNCPNPKCGLLLDDKDITCAKFKCSWCGQSIEFESSEVEVHRNVEIMSKTQNRAALSSPTPPSMEKSCPKCNRQISGSSSKCANCGAILLGKRQPASTPHAQSLQAETTDGHSFSTTIRLFQVKLEPVLFWMKTFLIGGGLFAFASLIALNSGSTTDNNLSNNIPFLVLSSGAFICGLLMCIIPVFLLIKNTSLYAPICLSCGRKLRLRMNINKCLRTGACPFCGFSRNTIPTIVAKR